MERHIWDPYADWGEVAQADLSASVKAAITGLGSKWEPNRVSGGLLAAIRGIMSDCLSKDERPITVVDFGCGLGRNLSLLRSIFPRVVGLDIPEMIARLRTEQGAGAEYDAVYDDLDVMLSSEQVHFVYDSVVLQHIVDLDYVTNVVDKLVHAKSFTALVSISITTSPPLAAACLVDDYHWNRVFHEVDTVSFGGSPHQVKVLCRPSQWRLIPRDGVIGIEPNGQGWRAITINGRPAPINSGWRAVELLSDFAPTLLLTLEKDGQRAVWYIAESGAFIGNSTAHLPPQVRGNLRHGMQRVVRSLLRWKLSDVGLQASSELLELVIPAATAK